MAAASPSPRRSSGPEPAPVVETVADLLRRLGRIPARRVRLHPTPGTATVRDLIKANARKLALCELVEGTLVEKPMGYEESELAATLIMFLNQFIRQHDLGTLIGEAGSMRILEGLVRLPDVAFVAKASYPGGKKPRGAVPAIALDLAVEVLSKSNTKAEIARKLREYFEAGTKLAWIVDPKRRTVRVHTGPTASTTLQADAVLDGGDVLPGFRLPLADLFPAAGD